MLINHQHNFQPFIGSSLDFLPSSVNPSIHSLSSRHGGQKTSSGHSHCSLLNPFICMAIWSLVFLLSTELGSRTLLLGLGLGVGVLFSVASSSSSRIIETGRGRPAAPEIMRWGRFRSSESPSRLALALVFVVLALVALFLGWFLVLLRFRRATRSGIGGRGGTSSFLLDTLRG